MIGYKTTNRVLDTAAFHYFPFSSRRWHRSYLVTCYSLLPPSFHFPPVLAPAAGEHTHDHDEHDDWNIALPHFLTVASA